MEPSLAKIEIINGHEMLYIPFTTTYGKPPLCMANSIDYVSYMPTMPLQTEFFLQDTTNRSIMIGLEAMTQLQYFALEPCSTKT